MSHEFKSDSFWYTPCLTSIQQFSQEFAIGGDGGKQRVCGTVVSRWCQVGVWAQIPQKLETNAHVNFQNMSILMTNLSKLREYFCAVLVYYWEFIDQQTINGWRRGRHTYTDVPTPLCLCPWWCTYKSYIQWKRRRRVDKIKIFVY